MKKLILITVMLCSMISISQIKGITGENWTKSWTNFKPKTTDYNEVSTILAGKIDKNTTLSKKNIYLLSGQVYVTNGATLTIEPGTLIRGDYETGGALIITKGCKIIAQGEETNPIVFTSNKTGPERKSGDWVGLVVLGDAPINRFGSTAHLEYVADQSLNIYGGANKDSDSGVLSYVRIEFAGKKTSNIKEVNSLSIAGVGRKTKISHIQVSFSNDDSFEFYGGDLALNNLVSFRASDDDYDFTEGIQCNINNSVAIRNPYVSNTGKSRCFEVDSYEVAANADLTKKLTNVIASNITLLNEEKEETGLTHEAIFVKENTFLTLTNSVVSGFNQCLLLDAKIKPLVDNFQKIKLENLLFNNCNSYIESELVENNINLKNWYTNDKFAIECAKSKNMDLFMENDVKKTPDYRIKNTSVNTSRLALN